MTVGRTFFLYHLYIGIQASHISFCSHYILTDCGVHVYTPRCEMQSDGVTCNYSPSPPCFTSHPILDVRSVGRRITLASRDQTRRSRTILLRISAYSFFTCITSHWVHIRAHTHTHTNTHQYTRYTHTAQQMKNTA